MTADLTGHRDDREVERHLESVKGWSAVLAESIVAPEAHGERLLKRVTLPAELPVQLLAGSGIRSGHEQGVCRWCRCEKGDDRDKNRQPQASTHACSTLSQEEVANGRPESVSSSGPTRRRGSPLLREGRDRCPGRRRSWRCR